MLTLGPADSSTLVQWPCPGSQEPQVATIPPLPAGCSEPLGLKDGSIPDKQITASSSYKTWNLRAFGWYPFYGRLDKQGKFNAWTAQSNDASEWLQVGQPSPHPCLALSF